MLSRKRSVSSQSQDSSIAHASHSSRQTDNAGLQALAQAAELAQQQEKIKRLKEDVSSRLIHQKDEIDQLRAYIASQNSFMLTLQQQNEALKFFAVQYERASVLATNLSQEVGELKEAQKAKIDEVNRLCQEIEVFQQMLQALIKENDMLKQQQTLADFKHQEEKELWKKKHEEEIAQKEREVASVNAELANIKVCANNQLASAIHTMAATQAMYEPQYPEQGSALAPLLVPPYQPYFHSYSFYQQSRLPQGASWLPLSTQEQDLQLSQQQPLPEWMCRANKSRKRK